MERYIISDRDNGEVYLDQTYKHVIEYMNVNGLDSYVFQSVKDWMRQAKVGHSYVGKGFLIVRAG